MKKRAGKDQDCCEPARARPDLRPVEGEEAIEELSKLCRALSHEIRIKILKILLERESCVCGELVVEFPVAQSTISQHLKILKEAGLIRGEVDGPRVCYCVEPATLRRLRALIGAI